MPITLRRRTILFGLFSVGWCSTVEAGPYFNTYKTEVDALSRDAVNQLGQARTAVIDMFNELDAGKQDSAENLRKRALGLLAQCQKTFQDIANKVGDRKLAFAPTTDDSKLVLAQFRNALERNKLKFPATERDLAALAVAIVAKYASTIEKADLRGFPKNWRGVRAIILSEIDLLYVGNLVSTVWVISKENS